MVSRYGEVLQIMGERGLGREGGGVAVLADIEFAF